MSFELVCASGQGYAHGSWSRRQTLVLGSWDSHAYIYSVDYAAIMCKWPGMLSLRLSTVNVVCRRLLVLLSTLCNYSSHVSPFPRHILEQRTMMPCLT